jgi:hypothetical protein
MARYGQAFKDRVVARLLPPQSASVEAVSREIGVGVSTLERWRAEALAMPERGRTWTAAARLEAVIATASSPPSIRRAPSVCSPITSPAASSRCAISSTGAGSGACRASMPGTHSPTMPCATGRPPAPAGRCPTVSWMPISSGRGSTWPCRRRCSPSWTMQSPRPSMYPKTWAWIPSSLYTDRPTSWDSRAVPASGRIPFSGYVLTKVQEEPAFPLASAARWNDRTSRGYSSS